MLPVLVPIFNSLFVMCKAGHQYNERLKALALLNWPVTVSENGQVLLLYCVGGANKSGLMCRLVYVCVVCM